MVASSEATACELSALRENELSPLVDALKTIPLAKFRYVSLHAPSRLETLTEECAVELLRRVVACGIRIVCHPDIISKPALWRSLGSSLLIENMDKRKPIGRTAEELEGVFDALPEAGFCLDLGHARQVDPTMGEARELLSTFGSRLRQLHVSEVNSHNAHEALNLAAIESFGDLASLLPQDVPAIIESPVPQEGLAAEMSRTLVALGDVGTNGAAHMSH